MNLQYIIMHKAFRLVFNGKSRTANRTAPEETVSSRFLRGCLVFLLPGFGGACFRFYARCLSLLPGHRRRERPAHSVLPRRISAAGRPFR
jgi:hypothetical protein